MDEKLSKEKCFQVMNKCNLNLRYGFDRFFKSCHRVNLPFYVVSGGVDIFISSILNSILDINEYENFFLYANKFIFNQRNQLVDLQMVIDATSKSEVLHQKNFKFNRNTLVFGDANHDFYIVSNQKVSAKAGI